MVDSPLYLHQHSKVVLMSAITRDTEFLASHLIMDYSLLIGVDESKELVIGIIGNEDKCSGSARIAGGTGGSTPTSWAAPPLHMNIIWPPTSKHPNHTNFWVGATEPPTSFGTIRALKLHTAHFWVTSCVLLLLLLLLM